MRDRRCGGVGIDRDNRFEIASGAGVVLLHRGGLRSCIVESGDAGFLPVGERLVSRVVRLLHFVNDLQTGRGRFALRFCLGCLIGCR